MYTSAILSNFTPGFMLYYGGFLGVGISVILFIVCLIWFPIQRNKKLRELGEE